MFPQFSVEFYLFHSEWHFHKLVKLEPNLIKSLRLSLFSRCGAALSFGSGQSKLENQKRKPRMSWPVVKTRSLLVLIISSSLLVLLASAKEYRQHEENFEIRPPPPAALDGASTASINSTMNESKRQVMAASQSREFLTAHNLVRLHLREPPLKWDRRLTRYARRFASQRIVDCKMVHSFGPYGENIFWGGRSSKFCIFLFSFIVFSNMMHLNMHFFVYFFQREGLGTLCLMRLKLLNGIIKSNKESDSKQISSLQIPIHLIGPITL